MKTRVVGVAVLVVLSLSAVSCATTDGGTRSVKPYPLTTCMVSGNDLGSMGPVITQVRDGQQLKFCCKPCVTKFNQDPGRYLSKLK